MQSHEPVTAFDLPAGALARARADCAAIGTAVTELGGRPVAVNADELITGRAALLGLGAPTRISCGGASRILHGADGWCALTLSRPDDIEAVPALVENNDRSGDPWEQVAAAAATQPVAEFVSRARLLDIPAAVKGEASPAEPVVTPHQRAARRTLDQLLVVDMSSMWAGPLCGRLLAAAGATVVKVESPDRPDGTRGGHRGFFDWVNSGKLSYSVAFGSRELATLLASADVVIEASRPAALARHGLDVGTITGRPGRIWLRISGYGAAHPQRIAFGDDAAVAGGLVAGTGGVPAFCGDAIADPLTGITATTAVLAALRTGGGTVIDVSMAAVAASHVTAGRGVDRPVRVQARAPVLPATPARPQGADNDGVRALVQKRFAGC